MRHLLIATTLLLAAVFAACGDDDDDGATDGTPTPTASAAFSLLTTTPTPRPFDDCSVNMAEPATTTDALTWEAVLPADIPAPSGYAITEAEGEGPFLNVSQDGTVVGSLELLQFEIPFDAADGYAALEAWAEHFYAGVQTDREAVGLNFDIDELTPVFFGDYCGIGYAYTVTDAAGTLTERFNGRGTFDGTKLYLITAFYDVTSASEGIGFTSPDALEGFEEGLDPLVESLNVPAD
jgi:hypothetical protein